MRRLFYMPLEPYKERYTVQLSAPKTGWLESRWAAAGINYHRVEGKSLNDEIKTGSVLDATGRGYWACSQVMELLRYINEGMVGDDDVIYFDDFWHPGISALPYAFYLTGIAPKMYAMLHAQTVDPFDFTYPMRSWMRHYEIGEGKVLDGIFVTSTCLRDMCLHAGVGDEDTVHICGLPYNSDEVRGHLNLKPGGYIEKEKQVIFTSRWDWEKRPEFFLKVVDYCSRRRNDISFLITTSARNIRSNNPQLINLLSDYMDRLPPHILKVETGLTKAEYYAKLLESAIQINTADQDFVSWTLLEATTWGCRPLYPYFLSFPEALEHRHEYMYVKGDVEDAGNKILKYIDKASGRILVEHIHKTYEWVYGKYDRSWERMLAVMKGGEYESLYNDQDSI